MVDRLLEQRKPLTLYGTKHDITLPSTNQWTLLEHATSLLTPIEQATWDVSASISCASMVIPMVIGIKHSLHQCTDDAGVQ